MKVEQALGTDYFFRRTVDGRGPAVYDPSKTTGDVTFSPSVVREVVRVRAEAAPIQPVPVTLKP